MKMSGFDMIRKIGAVGIASVSIALSATLLAAQTVTHRGGGWCLSYDRSDLPQGVEDITVPNSLPRFRLPDPSDEQERSFVVSYRKQDARSYSGFVEGNTDCQRTQFDFGLIRLDDNGAQECSLLPFATIYETVSDEGPNAAVSMHCHNDPTFPTCRLFDRYPSGWSIITRVPKDQLHDWSLFTESARNLFNSNLTDCGVVE